MKYEAILFDLDGTLVDTEPIHEQLFVEALAEYGVTLTPADFKTYMFGKPAEVGLKAYLERTGHAINATELIEKRVEQFTKLDPERFEPYPGAVELVRELSYQVPLALATNSSRVQVDIILQALDIDDCFDIIVPVDSVERGKPDPEGYLRAARLLSKDPKTCVVVEDSPVGVAAAKAAGIDCIAVTNTHTNEELKDADRIVSELDASLF